MDSGINVSLLVEQLVLVEPQGEKHQMNHASLRRIDFPGGFFVFRQGRLGV